MSYEDSGMFTFEFERYRNGVKMAQGVRITRANSFQEACEIATKIELRDGFKITDILVLVRATYGEPK